MSTPTYPRRLSRRTMLTAISVGAMGAALTGCGKTTYLSASDDEDRLLTPDTGLPQLRLTKIGTGVTLIPADDYVVAVSAADYQQGTFTVIDVATGQTRWKRSAGVLRSDVVTGADWFETVVAAGVGGPGWVISLVGEQLYPSFLVARDPKTGAKVWQRSIGGRSVASVDVVASSTHLLVSSLRSTGEGAAAQRLEAIDPATGSLSWQRPGLRAIAVAATTVIATRKRERYGTKWGDVVLLDANAGKDVAIVGFSAVGDTNLNFVLSDPYMAIELPPTTGQEPLARWACLDLKRRRRISTEALQYFAPPCIGNARDGVFMMAYQTGTNDGTHVEIRRAGHPIPSISAPRDDYLRPTNIVDGIIWCETGGRVVPVDPSGRPLSASRAGGVHAVNRRVLCLSRDGGAGPSEIYRIEKA